MPPTELPALRWRGGQISVAASISLSRLKKQRNCEDKGWFLIFKRWRHCCGKVLLSEVILMYRIKYMPIWPSPRQSYQWQKSETTPREKFRDCTVYFGRTNADASINSSNGYTGSCSGKRIPRNGRRRILRRLKSSCHSVSERATTAVKSSQNFIGVCECLNVCQVISLLKKIAEVGFRATKFLGKLGAYVVPNVMYSFGELRRLNC